MSGPWDRPSQDREGPASEPEATPENAEAGRSPHDAWPSNDLWADQRPQAGSSWDDWSTLPAPDDFVLDEPVSTLGDPWAESWAEEGASRERGPAPADEDRWGSSVQPEADRWASEPDLWESRPLETSRWQEPAAEPADWASERAGDPDAAEASPSPWQPAPTEAEAPDTPATAWGVEPSDSRPTSDAATWQPASDTGVWGAPSADPVAEPPKDAPRVAPWQSSDDAWGATLDEPAPAYSEAVPASAGTADVSPDTSTTEREIEPEVDDGARTTGGWRRDLLPAWLTGRGATTDESAGDTEAIADTEPVADTAPIAETEPVADTAPIADTESVADTAPIANTEPLAGAEAEAPAIDEIGSAEQPVTLEPDAWSGTTSASPFTPVGPAVTGSFIDDPAAAETDGPVDLGVESPSGVVDEPVGAAPGTADTSSGREEADRAVGSVDLGTVEDPWAPVEDPWARGPTELEADTPVAPVAAVAWDDDEPEAATPTRAWDTAAVSAADAHEPGWTEGVEGAAELESAPAAGVDPWPPADRLDTDAEADATAVEPEEATDPRFDSWLGASPGAPPAEGLHRGTAGAGTVTPDEPVVDAAEAPAGTEPLAPTAELAEADVAFVEPERAVAPVETSAWASEAGRPSLPDTGGRGDDATSSENDLVRRASVVNEAQAEPSPDELEQPARWRPEWLPDLEEPDAEERTRVLPTSWTPPPGPAESVDPSELAPHATVARTRPAADVERELEEDEAHAGASTAEQAVPWLIGFILLLAGMVIVLLALIFAGDASLGASDATPRPSLAVGAIGSPDASVSSAPSVVASPSVAASTPAPTPVPSASDGATPRFGPIELVYQGRAAALAPIYLLHREFTTEPDPEVLAQDPNLDLRRFAWSMDGSRGAGLYTDLLVSIEPSAEKRQLADGVVTAAFEPGGATVYAVRVTPDGGNDVAVVLAVDFASGDTREIQRFTYQRPPAPSNAALKSAQYEDEGGPVRLYWMEDNQLRLWVLNGGMWEIDPETGDAAEVPRRAPHLWSPDGRQRIALTESGATTTLTRLDADGAERGTTTVEGLVSHVRWSPQSDRIVFTLGRSAPNGGVLQDLFLWDLGSEAPTQITATGAAFGAEWLGARVRWREDPGET